MTVDRIMRGYAGLDRPGAGVLVMREQQEVFRRAYGMADLEAGIAATTRTNYRLASITKQFTAAAILRLAGRGALTLDERLRAHLPSLPPETDDITVRHLLTHTSGVVDYEDLIPAGTTVPLADREVLRLLESARRTDFAPGTASHYSNSGYALLALIAEKVSGRPFAELLREEIFLPLGMRDTVAHQQGVSAVANRAWGYAAVSSSRRAAWRRADQSLTSAVLGDGGVYSSIDDLAHWLAALDRGAFAAAMLPHAPARRPGVAYGYGWRIGNLAGRSAVWHTGESIGFRNALVRFPDDRLAVVILTNRSEGVPLELAVRLAGSGLGAR